MQSQQEVQPDPAGDAAGAAPAVAPGGAGEEGKSVATISLGTSLFFARVPPTVEVDAIRALFERYGEVQELNLFRPWATAKTSKVRASCCGSSCCFSC